MELKGCVAVITGGGSGIGEAVAKELTRDEVKVVLGDIVQDRLDRVATEIRLSGGQVETCLCNVTSDTDTAKMMDLAIQKFGSINIVVPCAGIIDDGLFISPDKESGKIKKWMSTEQFRNVIDVNLVGSFITLREAAIRMVKNNYKGILFTISSVQKVGGIGQLNYSSTKAAVAIWPKILVGEFQMKGIARIRVVSIAPSFVRTPMVRTMNQEVLASILKGVPLGRLIEPEEIAGLIKYVVINDAINATCIEITGGLISGLIAK